MISVVKSWAVSHDDNNFDGPWHRWWGITENPSSLWGPKCSYAYQQQPLLWRAWLQEHISFLLLVSVWSAVRNANHHRYHDWFSWCLVMWHFCESYFYLFDLTFMISNTASKVWITFLIFLWNSFDPTDKFSKKYMHYKRTMICK